ncbi:hypothetical protein Ddc_02832 [Ditylenchus destructor]|nr:hypothetical protein Ddc_02832 [Ditylenchus destructor]
MTDKNAWKSRNLEATAPHNPSSSLSTRTSAQDKEGEVDNQEKAARSALLTRFFVSDLLAAATTQSDQNAAIAAAAVRNFGQLIIFYHY